MDITEKYLHLKITAAEPERLLTQLIHSNIELLDITVIDFLTVKIKIRKSQYILVVNIAEHCGASCQLIGRIGILWSVQSILKRPVLLIGVLFFIFLSSMMNGRVFFIAVSGNEYVPEKVILSTAEGCGIGFGAKTSKVRSEEVKNLLLKQLPQLQWVGITTSGSVATIQVKERSVQDGAKHTQQGVSSIVSSRDGVISEMTVYKGTPIVRVGQSVQADDMLVSGYTDCGLVQLAEQAEAEIFAHTFRSVEAVTPTLVEKRGKCTKEHTCIKVRIGKKVINFCNHSGISDATCVKMYEEDYVTLPGGFQLPVSIIKMRTHRFCLSEGECNPKEMKIWLPQFACSYINDQMIAGKILDMKWQWNIDERLGVLKGSFACHEMIGRVKFEEIMEQNAEDS